MSPRSSRSRAEPSSAPASPARSDDAAGTKAPAPPVPTDLPPGPVTLSETERDAMPESLRQALAGWLHGHRAEQAQRVWHERLRIPSSGASLGTIGEVLLRCVADPGAPVSTLSTWLRAYRSGPGARAPFARPHDVVMAAVASRRLDLLTAVLDVPAFCPTEREREHWPLMRGPTPEQQAWQDRHGVALFNGGIAPIMGAKAQGPAHVLLTIAAAFSPGKPAEAQDLAQDPFWTWLAGQKVAAHSWQGLGLPSQLKAGDSPRARPHTNVLGLAVMMGWSDGVQALLDHDVNPYARDTNGTAQAAFMSPVVLAAHYGELDALQRLLQHPSFDPSRRYGYTDSQWERLELQPSNDGLVWSYTQAHHGGPELAFVANGNVGDDPTVSRTVIAALNGLKPAARRRLEQAMAPGLTPDGHRRWERWVLGQVVQNAPSDPERGPRARL